MLSENLLLASLIIQYTVREFLPNDWDEFAKTHHIGDDVIGLVSKITDFGLFVRLADGVEALAHISEIPREGKTKLDRMYQPGDPVRARIIKIDPGERKIGLTLRDVAALTDEERAEHAAPAALHAEHSEHPELTTHHEEPEPEHTTHHEEPEPELTAHHEEPEPEPTPETKTQS